VSIHLVVTQPFDSYKRGDLIVDPVLVASIVKGEHQHSVVQSIMKPEHKSGDFFCTDAELAEKRNPKPIDPVAPVVAKPV
jgi:hypothetical protein